MIITLYLFILFGNDSAAVYGFAENRINKIPGRSATAARIMGLLLYVPATSSLDTRLRLLGFVKVTRVYHRHNLGPGQRRGY